MSNEGQVVSSKMIRAARVRRWMAAGAWVLLVGVAGPVGCERGGGEVGDSSGRAVEQKTSAESANSDDAGREEADREETDREETDGGADEPEANEKQDWRNRVQQALREGDQQAEEADDDRIGCRMFPDDCPEGKSCFASRSGKRKCSEYNDEKSAGDACSSANDCAPGMQCVGGRPGTCLPTCRPENAEKWGCAKGAVCTPVEAPDGKLFGWGVCRKRSHECMPWPDDTCGKGEACLRTPVGRRCLTYDQRASAGDPCRQSRDCDAGQICVQSGSGPRGCRPKCDVDHPCQRGKCAPIQGRLIGFCTK